MVPPLCFLEDLGAASLVSRLDLADRFPASSSVSSSVASATSAAAFSLPLPLPLLPVSASTVVLVEETYEDDRARLELLLPAAETAVEEPEENEGERSRVRREGREVV